MIKKSRRPLYEPPLVVDLSALSVCGQVTPPGECVSGPKPYVKCVNGVLPEGEAPVCDLGTYADYPKCESGSSAAVVCVAGGAA